MLPENEEKLRGSVAYIYEDVETGCSCSGETYFPNHYTRFRSILESYGCSKGEFENFLDKVNRRWKETVYSSSLQAQVSLGACLMATGLILFILSFIVWPISFSGSDSGSINPGLIALPIVGIVFTIIGGVASGAGKRNRDAEKVSASESIQAEILDGVNQKSNLVWSIEVTTEYVVGYRRNRYNYNGGGAYTKTKRKAVLVAKPRMNPMVAPPVYSPVSDIPFAEPIVTATEAMPAAYSVPGATELPYPSENTGKSDIEQPSAPPSDKTAEGTAVDQTPTDQLYKLNELLKGGAITQAEYDKLKADILQSGTKSGGEVTTF